MVIICVGPDCAGKTSMIDSLVGQRKGTLVKASKMSPPFTEQRYDQALESLESQLNSLNDYIWDRIPLIDDFVYPSVMDGRKSYYEVSGELERVKELLKRCLIVYIWAEPAMLLRRAKMRAGENDKYLGRDIEELDLVDIQAEYMQVFTKLELRQNLHIINTTNMSPELAGATLIQICESACAQRKNVKVAHIVPKSSLYMTRDNQYHMCLAQFRKDEEYVSFFKRRAEEGKFVLLDNGAAEGTTTSMEDLIGLANQIGASEIILPDKLEDKEETLRVSTKAYEEYLIYRSKAEEGAGKMFGAMAVPQGASLEEWKECAAYMVEMYQGVTSFGVPKALAKDSKNPYARYYAVEYLDSLLTAKGRNTEIHLLGMNEPPMVIEKILDSFSRVRGVDSAFAYLCTQAAFPISNPYVLRPSGAIDFMQGEDLGPTLDINMQLLSIHLNQNENGVDYTWNLK